MKRPLVCLTAIFCLGILLANFIKIPFGLIYFLAFVFLILSFIFFKKGLKFQIILAGLIFLLGIALLKNSQCLPKCHISKYNSYKNNPYIIKGFIANQPVLQNNRTVFTFQAQEIQFDHLKYNCCGHILVYITGKEDLAYGQVLVLKGSLQPPFSYGNRNLKRWRNYLAYQGIYSILRVRTKAEVVRLNKNYGCLLKRFALWLKIRLEKIIFTYVSFLPASILEAMVLGEKRNIPAPIYNSMVKSGTVHILVVSGFNVGIVTFAIILFLKLIRIPRKVRIFLAISLLIIYCLITGASTPVVRATVMAVIFILAYLLKREPDIYNSCAIAALFILGVNPRQLFDIGFQLSFASVISLVYLYPKIKSFFTIDNLKIKPLKFIIEGCIVSLSAWLGTMGFIAYYFKIFSPVTILANLFIVPLATLITLSGFSLIIAGFILPFLAAILASTAELLVALLLNLNAFLIKIPGAYFFI
jgi:competence protein ComEC